MFTHLYGATAIDNDLKHDRLYFAERSGRDRDTYGCLRVMGNGSRAPVLVDLGIPASGKCRYAREVLRRATLPGLTIPSLGAWLRIVSATYDGARCA